MAEILEVGDKVQTWLGGVLEVKKYLAEGGQGRVYLVDYKGEKKALKWYKNIGLGEEFKNNIRQNIKRGAPSDAFLWPLDRLVM